MNWTTRFPLILFLLCSCSADPAQPAEADTLLSDTSADATDTPADSEEVSVGDTTRIDVVDVTDVTDVAPSSDVFFDLWDTAEPGPDGQLLTAVQSPTNALAFYVDWAVPPDSGAAEFQLECGADDIVHEFRDESDEGSGELFVMGLIADMPCRISLTTDAGVTSAEFTPGPLPEYLPPIEVQSSGTTQPGWTLVNLNNHFDEEPLSVALFDEQGRYRWYHYVSAEMGSDNEVTMVDGGVIIGGRSTLQSPQRIDWRGRQLWTLPGILMHHDIRYIDEDTVRFLADADHCDTGVKDGRVEDFNIETRETEWMFKLCEWYLPEGGPTPDWSHLNSIGPYGDSGILLSSREQHTFFLADRESGELVWSVGLHGSITPDEDAQFFRQHAPEEVADGNILLFDNGLEGTREFSRAIELAIDPEEGTAELVWEFVPDPPIAAYIWGDADRQPNGNTLITFGVRNVRKLTQIYEVNEAAEVMWQATFPTGWGVYRSDRVEPPGFIHLYP